MIVQTAENLLSFADYLNYDDGTDNRYELVLGKLELMTPPTVRHFLIAKFLEQICDREIEKKKLNWLCFREAGVRTGWQKSRLPDLFIVERDAAMALLDSSAVFQTTPFLIVEIASPESKKRDYRFKRCSAVLVGVSPQRIRADRRLTTTGTLRVRSDTEATASKSLRDAGADAPFKKRSEYAALEVPEYWIIDPQENKVTVLVLNEGLYEETVFTDGKKVVSSIFPELELKVREILEIQ